MPLELVKLSVAYLVESFAAPIREKRFRNFNMHFSYSLHCVCFFLFHLQDVINSSEKLDSEQSNYIGSFVGALCHLLKKSGKSHTCITNSIFLSGQT